MSAEHGSACIVMDALTHTGVVPSRVETTEGEFELDAWRYEKPL